MVLFYSFLWLNVIIIITVISSDIIYPFKFIYLFIFAALGLRCCTRAFSSCGEPGLLFIAVRGLLIAVASLVAERGL